MSRIHLKNLSNSVYFSFSCIILMYATITNANSNVFAEQVNLIFIALH